MPRLTRLLPLLLVLSAAALAVVTGSTKVALPAGYTAVAFREQRVTETYVTPTNTTTAAFTYDGTAYKQVSLSDRAALGNGQACFVFAAAPAELEYYAENVTFQPFIDLKAGYNLVSFSGFGTSGSAINATVNGTNVNTTTVVNPGVYAIGPGNSYTLVDLRSHTFDPGVAYWMLCSTNGVRLTWPTPVVDANLMSFSSNNLTVAPGGNLTINVRRFAFFGGNNTVQLVATPEGTAVQGTDYPPVNQTVSFTGSQASATVSVPIPQSARAGRTLGLRLQNPQGNAGALEAPAHVVVTIGP